MFTKDSITIILTIDTPYLYIESSFNKDYRSVNALSISISIIMALILSQSFSIKQMYGEGQCEVEITTKLSNNSNRMYPGKYAVFSANVSPDIPRNYTWVVEGPIVNDYDDDVYRSDNLTASQNLDAPTQMLPSDFRQSDIKFYWGPNSTDSNRTVSVIVQTFEGGTCTDSQSYIIERNYDDIDLQPEDFYVESNHPDAFDPSTTNVLKQHMNWHNNYSFWSDSYVNNGDLFFDFHRLYIAHFDAFRNLFGYDAVKAWNPGTEIPTGIDIDHVNREVNHTNPYVIDPLPNWFKHHPLGQGPAIRPVTIYDDLVSDPASLPEELRGMPIPCEREDAPNNSSQYPPQQDALIDFEADQELLGCAITTPYHNERHGTIGGDMSFTSSAPLDPIFWRLHKYIDSVSGNRFFPQMVGEEAEGIIPIGQPDLTPPRIFSQNPFRLNQYITGLPLITEQQSDLFGVTNVPAISAEFTEPVFGIKATDFSVNGSPATAVNGSGTGPYVFIGFDAPSVGQVNVTFSPGNIKDESGTPFEGDSWIYTIIEPQLDSDSDGLSDEIEVESILTNPTISDTDSDGILDGIETLNPCLTPLESDAHVMNMSGFTVNETGVDTDNDGVTNVQEVNQGTDPCLAPENANVDLQDVPPQQQTGVQPFLITVTTKGGISGTDSTFSYDSLTGEAISIVNDNATTRKILASDEELVIRALNNSGFFESDDFYLPSTSTSDDLEYTLFALLGNKLHGVYWTDTSEQVPEPIRNLPYALARIIGEGSEFKGSTKS